MFFPEANWYRLDCVDTFKLFYPLKNVNIQSVDWEWSPNHVDRCITHTNYLGKSSWMYQNMQGSLQKTMKTRNTCIFKGALVRSFHTQEDWYLHIIFLSDNKHVINLHA